MALTIGDCAPFFSAKSPSNPDYAFDSVAGRYVVLAFYPSLDPEEAKRITAAIAANRALFDDDKLAFFGVLRTDALTQGATNQVPGIRWFFDTDRAISNRFGMETANGETAGWLVLDPMLRVIISAPLQDTARVMAALRALPAVDDHAGAPLFAPVLLVPRVFSPDLCARLIGAYEHGEQSPSGYMREIDGRTVGVFDSSKKRRRDHIVEDPALLAEIRHNISKGLLPQIERAFNFTATRMERYLVGCYSGEEQGFFAAHRDNVSKGTAHRRFAVTINLNSEQYEGGGLVFPEFGSRTYRPPTGGAVVFGCGLLHAAQPVLTGRRYAFLPFLYDERAARLREQNTKYLEPGSDDYRANPS
ncbi:hypothetical protein BH10PSE4_BH10PSE4_11120 [soil metagenome]